MKHIIPVILLLAALGTDVRAQVYTTRSGFIGFYSKMPLEDIRAENHQAYAAVDAGKKSLAFMVLLKGFVFTKELMQEHFNENYVESDKYPRASFSGTWSGDWTPDKAGKSTVQVHGQLTLHNVTRTIDVPATLEMKDGKLTGQAAFKLKPEDFNMQIPSIVRDKIAQEMSVRVQIECSTNK